MKDGAFTLIELLTAIAIAGILTTIFWGVGGSASDAGKIARARAELATISAALEGYKRQHGDYPQTDDEAVLLQSLIGRLGPRQAAIAGRTQLDLALLRTGDARDPFVAADAVLVDPWEQPYVYAYKVPAPAWTNPGFVLYAIGRDGRDDPALSAGGAPNLAAAGNADNLYANP